MGVDFALSRTIRDTAVLLDAVAAPNARLATPERPYEELVRIDPGRLRISVTVAPWSRGAVVA